MRREEVRLWQTSVVTLPYTKLRGVSRGGPVRGVVAFVDVVPISDERAVSAMHVAGAAA